MECTLYLTDSCNLKCSYCYEGDSKNSTFLTEEKLRLALNYIKTNNPVNDDIHLTLLGGEPLLNKKLLRKVFEINSHARLACYTMNKTGVASGSFS